MYADDTTLVSHLENFGPLNDIKYFGTRVKQGNIKSEYLATV